MMLYGDFGFWEPSLWANIMVLGSAAVPVAIAGFVDQITHSRTSGLMAVGFLAFISVQVANFAGLIIQNISIHGNQLTFTLGHGAFLLVMVWIIFLLFSVFRLTQAYRAMRVPQERSRAISMFCVIACVAVGEIMNLTPLQGYPIDIAMNIAAAVILTVAVMKNQFQGLSRILRNDLQFYFPAGVIGLGYFLAFWAVRAWLPNLNDNHLVLFSIFSAIPIALAIEPVRSFTATYLDRLFFREQANAGLMLQRVSQATTSVLDLQQLTQMILTEICSALHVNKAAFFIRDVEKEAYVSISTFGISETSILQWDITSPFVRVMEDTAQALTYHELIQQPRFQTLRIFDRLTIAEVDAEIFIPIRLNDALAGIMVLGQKKSGDPYTPDDLIILTTLANHSAAAIEKARLLHDERSRRAELNALYELSRRLMVIDDLQSVLTETVKHIASAVHVTLARILILNPQGQFQCLASHSARALNFDIGVTRQEPLEAILHYRRALHQQEPYILAHRDPGLNQDTRHALLLDHLCTLVLVPMRIGDQAIGLLVLGEMRDISREPVHAARLHLMKALADQTANAIQRAKMSDEIEENFLETVLALARATDARDTNTLNHSRRLAVLTEMICRELGFSETAREEMNWASLLHDIGKIGISDSIMLKRGRLDADEWAIMRRHPEISANIIAPIHKLTRVAPIVRSHHERYDGTGYPDGLEGEQIPLGARILAIADAYDAMTDNRVYRMPFSHNEAIEELRRFKGSQFDPELVDVFIQVMNDTAVLPHTTFEAIHA